MEHNTIDGLLGAAEESCRRGRLREAQSFLDQWSIRSPKRATFRATSLQSSLDNLNAARQSELEYAAEEGYSFLVSFLLEQGAEITNLVHTAACKSGSTEVFQEMLNYGWDINRQSRGSMSNSGILMSDKLTDWHLEHGADPNLHSGTRNTPLVLAAYWGSVHVVKSLVSYGAKLEGTEAVIAAAASMNENPEPIKIMAYLLDSGVDIDRLQCVDEAEATTFFTGTALHQAVEKQDVERVRFLLQRGANRNIKGFRGFTPIEAAEIMGLNEMTDILRVE
ncbi:ankyrin [Lepidopterella palustris CBS 459.81]|uniref:Ankyrin n=1 Tax=Lepidopterella palustris CBS 459.81 TaxID=1314670 RepID=A0A8E2DWH1_9PEZI|nr:ankyrin [Lepidopterella palustris CBS 459.81]